MDDTIVGISAPIGGAVSIIRLSGADSLAILQKIFSKKKFKPQSHRIYYGWIKDGGRRIDEVLVSIMLAPQTFTREDVVEINCHGGALTAQKILQLTIRHGARLAEAGEFTKRAFLNGRISLSQAEAVADIINAKSELSHKAAINQLQGRLGTLLNACCDLLLSFLARIEMAIDYPEYDEADVVAADVCDKLLEIMSNIDKLLQTASQGRIIRDGIKTAIIGRPNVGKSSLLNTLAGQERAIVTHIPGTTRDVLRESVRLGDIFLEIADTAGIRQTDDLVEKEGVTRSKQEAQQADLVLLVLDGSNPITDDEITALGSEKWQHTIVVINKSDLPIKIDKNLLSQMFGEDALVEISAKEHRGIDRLCNKIRDKFFTGLEYSQDIVTNTRHIALLEAALNSLAKASEAIKDGVFIDLAAIDIQDAYRSLGAITGIVVEESLIEKIFSEFCLGK